MLKELVILVGYAGWCVTHKYPNEERKVAAGESPGPAIEDAVDVLPMIEP